MGSVEPQECATWEEQRGEKKHQCFGQQQKWYYLWVEKVCLSQQLQGKESYDKNSVEEVPEV